VEEFSQKIPRFNTGRITLAPGADPGNSGAMSDSLSRRIEAKRDELIEQAERAASKSSESAAMIADMRREQPQPGE